MSGKEAVDRAGPKNGRAESRWNWPRELQVGPLLLADVVAQLSSAGPRSARRFAAADFQDAAFSSSRILAAGMELYGSVLNVVDFGAFVDIGLRDSGLVHVSQLANRYVRDPHEVAAVGDIVKVWVMEIDKTRRRVSLTMIPPGSKRHEPPHRPRAGRGHGEKPVGEQCKAIEPADRGQVVRTPVDVGNADKARSGVAALSTKTDQRRSAGGRCRRRRRRCRGGLTANNWRRQSAGRRTRRRTGIGRLDTRKNNRSNLSAARQEALRRFAWKAATPTRAISNELSAAAETKARDSAYRRDEEG